MIENEIRWEAWNSDGRGGTLRLLLLKKKKKKKIDTDLGGFLFFFSPVQYREL